MNSFTTKLFSNTSVQLFADNTDNSCTDFLPEQLNQEGQREVSTSEVFYPSTYRNVTKRKFMFFDENFSKLSKYWFWELVFILPTRILLRTWTLSFKKDTFRAKAPSPWECLEELRKMRFTLYKKEIVLHFLVRTWDTFSEVISAMSC